MKTGWLIEVELRISGGLVTGYDMAQEIKSCLPNADVYVATSELQPDDQQRRCFLVYTSDLDIFEVQRLMHAGLPNLGGLLQKAPESLQPKD